MSLIAFRGLYLATVDTAAYSCMSRCRLLNHTTIGFSQRYLSTEASNKDQLSENDVVNHEFMNRNPRNLEFMGLSKKRKGWDFQYPPVEFYHKLMFQRTTRNLTAWVEHTSGKVVLSASTKEYAIAKHLYRTSDVSAAENIGRVLAQRCRECGITSMISQPPGEEGLSKNLKYEAFLKAIEDEGVELKEIEEVVPGYEPGINYDNEWEYQNLLERQNLATKPSAAVWGTEKDNRI